jgi:hypothetical protein
MSLSRFLWTTSTGLAALAPAGCSDDSCGLHGAPSAGLVASGDQVTLTFGALSALDANDCPLPGTPAGVISVTIEGTQTDGTGLITLCIPRPDQLADGGRSLGTATSMADVRLIDVRGMSGGCTFTIDSTQAPTGQAGAEGVCKNGVDPAGFALDIDGALTLRRTCNTQVDTVPATLKGRVAVTKR